LIFYKLTIHRSFSRVKLIVLLLLLLLLVVVVVVVAVVVVLVIRCGEPRTLTKCYAEFTEFTEFFSGKLWSIIIIDNRQTT